MYTSASFAPCHYYMNRIFTLLLIIVGTILHEGLSNFAGVELSWFDRSLEGTRSKDNEIIDTIHVLIAMGNGIFMIVFSMLGNNLCRCDVHAMMLLDIMMISICYTHHIHIVLYISHHIIQCTFISYIYLISIIYSKSYYIYHLLEIILYHTIADATSYYVINYTLHDSF